MYYLTHWYSLCQEKKVLSQLRIIGRQYHKSKVLFPFLIEITFSRILKQILLRYHINLISKETKVVCPKEGRDWVLPPQPLLAIKGMSLREKIIISYHRVMLSPCFFMGLKVCMLHGTRMIKIVRVGILKCLLMIK